MICVFSLKSVDELYNFPLKDIVGADTNQVPKRKRCMDNHNLIRNNLAHLKYGYISVAIDIMKKIASEEPVQQQNNEIQSGTGMLHYLT
jgi:hypothetical protein